MPQLENNRHETYALMRAKGMKPAQAGAVAGFAPGSSTASELEKDPEVKVRIQELFEELGARRDAMRDAAAEAAKVVGTMTGVSKAWVVKKLAENAQNAANDGDYKESNAALKLIGDEFGMFKGVSGEGQEDHNGQRVFDLDALEAVLSPAGKITAEKVESDRDLNPQVALDLIAGNGNASKRMREARALTHGSEVDMAEHEDTDLDVPSNWSGLDPATATEEEIGEWTAVDPQTDPADLVAMALGETPVRPRGRQIAETADLHTAALYEISDAPEGETQAPDPSSDDRPTRRSSR